MALVATVNPTGDANPGHFAVFNNKLYFAATDGNNGVEIWVLYWKASAVILAASRRELP